MTEANHREPKSDRGTGIIAILVSFTIVAAAALAVAYGNWHNFRPSPKKVSEEPIVHLVLNV